MPITSKNYVLQDSIVLNFFPSLAILEEVSLFWHGRKFSGHTIFQNEFAQNVELSCSLWS